MSEWDGSVGRRASQGERNHSWKDGRSKYQADHQWLRVHFDHEKQNGCCESCGVECRVVTTTKGGAPRRNLEWAFLGPADPELRSVRDRDAYAILCHQCHVAFDALRQSSHL